ncbi:MAG: redoxin family protein [Bacteroidetes bacterium]|nr:redoxin family protein [Bacteroidota bacterium]MBS1974503.1 redoxin family protein [Bacteroidota bacterium]
MRKEMVAEMLLALFSLFSFQINNPVGLPIGSVLPKAGLAMQDVSGKTSSMQQAKRQNGLLVMFGSNVCPVVQANQSRIKEICQYALDNKIGVAIINSNEGGRNTEESFESMRVYAKAQSYSWFYLLDRKSVVADAFGAARTPECFLFDMNNKLVYHGAIGDSPGDIDNVRRHYLHEAIDEMVAGKNILVKETRSIGCSIFRG